MILKKLKEAGRKWNLPEGTGEKGEKLVMRSGIFPGCELSIFQKHVKNVTA
jgi:hypothetical protein